MGSQVQSYLAPLSTPNSIEFNKSDVSNLNKVQDRDAGPQVEFHTMLQNSNADLARERAAKKTGDLSSAKTDEEFRKMLSEKANPKRTPKNTLGKDDFLKLFIAQMQSQDPLNPQDSSQMAAQMAQFNSLEQMMNVNKTLETMLQTQSADRAVGMVNYVGKEVDVGTGMLKWNKDKITKSTFEVEQPLSNAFVEVRDASGQVISQQELGNIMPGEHNLKWNGKLKDGSPANPGVYHFSIIGKSIEGQDIPIPIKSKVKITGVDLKTPGGAFFTELGKLEVKDVASVGLQGFEDIKPLVAAVEATGETANSAGESAPQVRPLKLDSSSAPDANVDLPTSNNLEIFGSSQASDGTSMVSELDKPTQRQDSTPQSFETNSSDGIVDTKPSADQNIPITFAGQ